MPRVGPPVRSTFVVSLPNPEPMQRTRSRFGGLTVTGYSNFDASARISSEQRPKRYRNPEFKTESLTLTSPKVMLNCRVGQNINGSDPNGTYLSFFGCP